MMRYRWAWAWALQIAEALAVGLLASLANGAGAVAYAAAVWGLVPLSGMVISCRAVGRGLNNYLAWIAPAGGLFAAHFLVWGFSPPAGAGLLTALLSLIGAAAGEVLRRRKKPVKHDRKRR